MKLYRPKFTITCVGHPTETFYANFVTMFPSFKCGSQREDDFKAKVSLLYMINHNIGDPEKELNITDLNIKTDYITLETNLLLDIWGYICYICRVF